MEVRRSALHFFMRPTLLGAIYLTALTLRAGSRGAVEGDDLGERGQQIAAFVEGRFGHEITRAVTALVAAAIVLGAAVGLAAGLLVRLRERVGRSLPAPRWTRALHVLATIAVLHGWLEARSMARAPQLYAAAFYAEGGALRTLQVFVTDVLGPFGVNALGVAALLLYLAGPRSGWWRWRGRLRRAFLPGAVAAAAALLLGTAPGARLERTAHARDPSAPADPTSRSQPRNVLILAADSLRDDRVAPRTAPHLAELAGRSARFQRAYVSLPRTFPSWVTLLSGRHPHHHGIRNMFPRWEERTRDFDALPARLARAGYHTAVVSDYAGDIFGRVDLGWTRVDTPSFDFRQLVRQRAVERMTPLLPFLHTHTGRRVFPVMRELQQAADPSMLADEAIRHLDQARGRPFFLTVFFSTAHFPYAAPAPYYSAFADRSYRGRFKYHKPVGLGREAPPDAADEAQVRALYDGAVLSIDAACARVLDALRERGLDKDTVVVVLADHGESIFESGRGIGHGDHLFGDEGTHIPLVIHDPRAHPVAQVRDVVRDVDLAPTLYELTGVAPPPDLDGRSLVPALQGRPLAPALAYAETGLWFTEEIAAVPAELRLPYADIARLTEIDPDHGDELVLVKEARWLTRVAKHRMVRDDRFKLVYAPTRAAPRYLLFDTTADPAEEHDVAAAHPDEVLRLRRALEAWMVQDRDMELRGGYLVPREATAASEKVAR